MRLVLYDGAEVVGDDAGFGTAARYAPAVMAVGRGDAQVAWTVAVFHHPRVDAAVGESLQPGLTDRALLQCLEYT